MSEELLLGGAMLRLNYVLMRLVKTGFVQNGPEQLQNKVANLLTRPFF